MSGCGGATVLTLGEPGKDGGASDGGTQADTGGHCNLVQLLTPILTITDAVTGAPICDAFVEGTNTTASLSACTGGYEGCTGTCPYTVNDTTAEGGGTFSVIITAPGYDATDVTGLEIQTCGCGGTCGGAEQVNVSLQPATFVDGGLPVDASPPPIDGGAGSPCPSTAPASGDACGVESLYCEYGADPNPYCNTLFECQGGAWTDMSTGGICAPPGSICPDYATASARGRCGVQGFTCEFPEGTCVCTGDPGGLPIANGPVWDCTPVTSGCPAERPALGSSCSVDPSLDCDYGQCSGGVGESCTNGYWSLAMVACPA